MAAKAKAAAPEAPAELSRQRLDKWLWIARFAKSRTLAQALIEAGKIRVNRERVTRTASEVKAGDVLTMSLGPRQRVILVVGFRDRRGSATLAAALYEDKTPPPIVPEGGHTADPRTAVREPGSGRPTKRDRRRIIGFKSHTEDP